MPNPLDTVRNGGLTHKMKGLKYTRAGSDPSGRVHKSALFLDEGQGKRLHLHRRESQREIVHNQRKDGGTFSKGGKLCSSVSSSYMFEVP